MNIEELKAKMPWIDVTEWRQHPNGGGWIYKDATVGKKVFLGQSAVVTGSARVDGSAGVTGSARVTGSAWVDGSAVVDGSARVDGSAVVTGSARVTGSAWVFSPLYIQGSVHPITVSSHTEVSVGCKKHTIGWWMDHYAEVGKGEGYTDAQISEYGALLSAVKAWMDAMLPKGGES